MKKILLTILVGFTLGGLLIAGPQKYQTIESAKALAARAVVETVYGVKIRFSEEVNNIIDGSFRGTAETKTGERKIKNLKYEVVYDEAKDIAKVTASVRLGDIADLIDKENFNVDKNPDKVIRRVAFASSRPENARKLAALRAAEIDAYKNLYKEIAGFTLESNTKVENFVMKSDKIKASVLGCLMGAELVNYRWEGKDEDAVVKLRINIKELNEMLPSKIKSTQDTVEVEGYGAQAPAASTAKSSGNADKRANAMVTEQKIDLNP